MSKPRVTVGLPVYNGEKSVAAALECLAAQDFSNFTAVISDNGSTDETAPICRRFAETHPNFIYYRQPQTLPVMDNYRFVLQQATTEYFMWLAADDLIAPCFISRNCSFLDSHPGYVSSHGKVLFHEARIPVRFSRGTFGLRSNTTQNLAAYLHKPQDNSRFYGLFRTHALQASYPEGDFLALDWAVMAMSLIHGRQNEFDDVLTLRHFTPPEVYQYGHDRKVSGALDRMFPVLKLTSFLLRQKEIRTQPQILYRLLRLNWIMTRDYVTHRRYMQAKARAEVRVHKSGIRHIRDRLVMKMTDPNPGPSFDDQMAALRRWIRKFRKPGTLLPELIRTSDEGWSTIPSPEGASSDVSLVLAVKDRLQDTLRIMQSIPPAIGPLSYQIIVIDCGSTDVTSLSFHGRKDLGYVSLGPAASCENLAQAVLKRARGAIVLFIDPGIRLHVGSLEELARGLQECRICVPACLGEEHLRETGPVTIKWPGLFATYLEDVRRCSGFSGQPFSHSGFAEALAASISNPESAVARRRESLVSRI